MTDDTREVLEGVIVGPDVGPRRPTNLGANLTFMVFDETWEFVRDAGQGPPRTRNVRCSVTPIFDYPNRKDPAP